MNTLMLGWLANILFIYGVYALGKKNIIGFYANTLGNILYFIQAIILNNTPLWWLCTILALLNIQAIIKWRKNEKNTCKK